MRYLNLISEENLKIPSSFIPYNIILIKISYFTIYYSCDCMFYRWRDSHLHLVVEINIHDEIVRPFSRT